MTSLKIEGTDEAAGVHSRRDRHVYRKYLDLLFEKNGPANPIMWTEKDRKYLLDLFNRGGSCTGYYQMRKWSSDDGLLQMRRKQGRFP